MSEQEKNKVKRIAEALPEQAKQILLAYGEDMAVMADRQHIALPKRGAARDSA